MYLTVAKVGVSQVYVAKVQSILLPADVHGDLLTSHNGQMRNCDFFLCYKTKGARNRARLIEIDKVTGYQKFMICLMLTSIALENAFGQIDQFASAVSEYYEANNVLDGSRVSLVIDVTGRSGSSRQYRGKLASVGELLKFEGRFEREDEHHEFVVCLGGDREFALIKSDDGEFSISQISDRGKSESEMLLELGWYFSSFYAVASVPLDEILNSKEFILTTLEPCVVDGIDCFKIGIDTTGKQFWKSGSVLVESNSPFRILEWEVILPGSGNIKAKVNFGDGTRFPTETKIESHAKNALVTFSNWSHDSLSKSEFDLAFWGLTDQGWGRRNFSFARVVATSIFICAVVLGIKKFIVLRSHS
ncbi:MAG: hypothetical protein KDB03_15045 [Planctomycetales bacterium]|nr:hypothetical protein [Planctomycetales bacterium]